MDVEILVLFLSWINALLPKKKKKIVLYANLGFRDNVKGLYEYLIAEGYHQTYELVCVSNQFYDVEKVPRVRYCGLYEGVYHFLTARYFFYCFGKYPIKPSQQQVVVNLWHGMPLKKIGNLEDHLKDKDFNFFSKLVVTSEFFKPVMAGAFKAKEDQLLLAGNPRCDALYRPIDVADGASKRLLWLPTYRESEQPTGLLFQLEEQDWLEMDTLLTNLNSLLYLKLHPLEAGSLGLPTSCQRITLVTDADLSQKGWEFYSFLGAMDGLLTDYSSVFLDYLLLNRPIGFVHDDMEDYRASRGFIFEDMGSFFVGERLLTKDELLGFLDSFVNGEDAFVSQRQELNQLVNEVTEDICQDLLKKIGLEK